MQPTHLVFPYFSGGWCEGTIEGVNQPLDGYIPVRHV